jgi:hypothetical protein
MHFICIDVVLYIQLMCGLWIRRTSEVGLLLVPLIRMAEILYGDRFFFLLCEALFL